MSDERLERRRFLADLLFAGGALASAALIGWVKANPPPPEELHYPVYQSTQGGVERP